MTQPGLLGLVFGGRITGISWLPGSRLLRLPLEKRTTAPSWNFARGGGKFALPQTLYLAAITREYLSSYPGKALMQCCDESTACSRLHALHIRGSSACSSGYWLVKAALNDSARACQPEKKTLL
jgi:hypothetical protein